MIYKVPGEAGGRLLLPGRGPRGGLPGPLGLDAVSLIWPQLFSTALLFLLIIR